MRAAGGAQPPSPLRLPGLTAGVVPGPGTALSPRCPVRYPPRLQILGNPAVAGPEVGGFVGCELGRDLPELLAWPGREP